MAERPITFCNEMVRAILDGRKTATRRVVRKPARAPAEEFQLGMEWAQRTKHAGVMHLGPCDGIEWKAAPPCIPGDNLWVRETWWKGPDGGCPGYYRADCHPHGPGGYTGKWSPGRYMPRWASRINLAVTSVRVERLHEITDAGAAAEGVEGRDEFLRLWDSLNAKRGFGVAQDPWVWVIEFERNMKGAT